MALNNNYKHYDTFNRPYSYSLFWTRTSVQWMLHFRHSPFHFSELAGPWHKKRRALGTRDF